MKTLAFYFLLGVSLLATSCGTESESDRLGDAALDGRESSEATGGGQNGPSGLITAGEWNDLDNWQFWVELISKEDYATMPEHWDFYNKSRVSILLANNNEPIVNAKIELFRNGVIEWESKTDNFGKAELWIHLFDQNQSVDISDYSLSINGQQSNYDLTLFESGIVEIEHNVNQSAPRRVELGFIVDATGSMSDELEFLKNDLKDVIERVEGDNSALEIHTASVFYRDEGEEYVVRKSEFSSDLQNTLGFISDQSSDGGGDFPEAVHSALKAGIEELQWSESARTRIAFLLLDAPPHHELQVIEDLQNYIKGAAKKGIKIIPITASGINKETEFLMRFFAMSTNGTYVFITDDSGIGGDHLEPSVGEFQVEFLNDLMVNLISKYTK